MNQMYRHWYLVVLCLRFRMSDEHVQQQCTGYLAQNAEKAIDLTMDVRTNSTFRLLPGIYPIFHDAVLEQSCRRLCLAFDSVRSEEQLWSNPSLAGSPTDLISVQNTDGEKP